MSERESDKVEKGEREYEKMNEKGQGGGRRCGIRVKSGHLLFLSDNLFLPSLREKEARNCNEIQKVVEIVFRRLCDTQKK